MYNNDQRTSTVSTTTTTPSTTSTVRTTSRTTTIVAPSFYFPPLNHVTFPPIYISDKPPSFDMGYDKSQSSFTESDDDSDNTVEDIDYEEQPFTPLHVLDVDEDEGVLVFEEMGNSSEILRNLSLSLPNLNSTSNAELSSNVFHCSDGDSLCKAVLQRRSSKILEERSVKNLL